MFEELSITRELFISGIASLVIGFGFGFGFWLAWRMINGEKSR